MSKTSPIKVEHADFENLFEQYRPGFVAVARSYVRDSMVAEDIVAECFAYYWENRDRIEIARSIPAYILTSVKHRCLNWLRDERNRLRVQQNIHSQSLRTISQRIASLETHGHDSIFEDEIAAITARTIAGMPERMRAVFNASRLEDMTYRQIAEKFSLSLNQVDFEIRKASGRLSRALKDYLPSS